MQVLGANSETRNELVKVLFYPNGCTDQQVDSLVEEYSKACKAIIVSTKDAMKTANLMYINKR